MSAADKKREDRKRDNQKYLRENCDQIMRRMVLDLLKAKPDDVLEFMATWIGKERGVDPKEVDKKVAASLGHAGHAHAAPAAAKHHDKSHASDASDDEGDEANEMLEKLKKKKEQTGNKGRAGVSAEVYGANNKKEPFVPKVIPKSDEAKKRIYEKLNKNFLFKSLDPDNKNIVIDAMDEKKFSKGSHVIKQGEDGDVLYLVDSGLLKCYKRFPGKDADTFLLNYKPGDAFGE